MPGTDSGTLFASIAWRRTWCLAPIWVACLLASDLASHLVPGTDLGLGTLFASIDLASHPVPGTDSGSLFASIAWRRTRCLAPIWAPCLLASDLALHLVPGTGLGTLWELLYDNLHCRVTVSSCRQAQRTLP